MTAGRRFSSSPPFIPAGLAFGLLFAVACTSTRGAGPDGIDASSDAATQPESTTCVAPAVLETDFDPSCATDGSDAGRDASRGVDSGPDDASASDSGPADPATARDGSTDAGDAGNATVSFANDVMPIFQQGCTLSSVCHGQMGNAGEENLYLGDNTSNTPTAIALVYQGLVGVKSAEDPLMNQITAGDVANSYLSHKLVGDQGTLGAQCATTGQPCVACTLQMPCGTSMPYLASMLDASELALINAWIGQGARSN